MGYTGGTRENPTYHRLGDHTETVEIEFDPEVVSYGELLKVFWKNHDPYGRAWSRQYMSAVFYHDETQKRQAMESLKQEESTHGAGIQTKILPAARFYSAEDYHQKYYLRQRAEVVRELRRIFPTEEKFIDSTAAARLNGYFGGNLSLARLEAEMKALGLPDEENKRILGVLPASAR